MKNRIVIDPRILAGKPTIEGTRIPVDLILKLLAQGITIKEILKEHPRLTKADIQAALQYTSNILKNEETFPLTIKGTDYEISSR